MDEETSTIEVLIRVRPLMDKKSCIESIGGDLKTLNGKENQKNQEINLKKFEAY